MVRPPAVRFEDLPPISTVLLSHNHYDHCDIPTPPKLAKRFDPLVGRRSKMDGSCAHGAPWLGRSASTDAC